MIFLKFLYVRRWFQSHREPEYARSGSKATQTVILDQGPLPHFPFSMEPQLRKLGLPTTLKKGNPFLRVKFIFKVFSQ